MSAQQDEHIHLGLKYDKKQKASLIKNAMRTTNIVFDINDKQKTFMAKTCVATGAGTPKFNNESQQEMMKNKMNATQPNFKVTYRDQGKRFSSALDNQVSHLQLVDQKI